jgi:hypothetical protein
METAVDFEIPDDITALSDEDLATALSGALSAARAFENEGDDLTDEQVERLVALAGFATAARQAQAARVEAATARADRAAAARAELAEPEPEPEPEPTEDPEPEPEPAPTPEPAGVAAAAPRVSVVSQATAATVGRTTTPAVPARVLPALTASADVPGYSTGGKIEDLTDIGDAMVSRMRGLPTARLGGDQGIRTRHSVAKVDLGPSRSDGLIQNNYRDDNELLVAASKTSRLPGGSLTAAGGWCAPSETLYDLCSIASTDGLLDLPTIQVNRGGIRFTKAPTFADIYAEAAGWNFTEAEVIAGVTKPCAEITCPPFQEVRLNALGLCIRAPLLTQAAYPELVRHWIEQLLISHQHIVDAWRIGEIVAGSTALDATGDFQTTVDGIAKLEQIGNWVRQSSRMPFNQALEMLVPFWFRTTVRADLARRTGVDMINVSDATIEAYFSARNISIQWLYNFQPLVNTAGVVDTPDEVDVVVYPSGTWVSGSTDVISLDAVYDSTSLAANEYTALFAETGELIVNPCFDSYLITLPTSASGRTGAADLTSAVLGTQPVVVP